MSETTVHYGHQDSCIKNPRLRNEKRAYVHDSGDARWLPRDDYETKRFENVSSKNMRNRSTSNASRGAMENQSNWNCFAVNKSESTSGLNKSHEGILESNYVLSLERTPSHMTPSMRLKLRRLQKNKNIAQLSTKTNKLELDHINADIDQGEIDINDRYLYNVPFSQSLPSLSSGEKLVMNGKSSRDSTSTNSTTSSSLSLMSNMDSVSSFDVIENNKDSLMSYEKSTLTRTLNSAHSHHYTETNQLNMPKEALKLTLLFSRSESALINEESVQKRSLLRKLTSTPPSPTSDIHNYQRNIQSANDHNQGSHTQPFLNETATSLISYTRPSWLPPKPSKEKKAHHRASEEMISRAIANECNENSKRLQTIHQLERLKKKDRELWNKVLNDSKQTSQEAVKRILENGTFWRGTPESLRGSIWSRMIGNRLEMDQESCTTYFESYERIKSIYCMEADTSLSNYRKREMGVSRCHKTSKALHHKHACEKLSSLNAKILRDISCAFPEVTKLKNEKTILDVSRILNAFVIFCNKSRGLWDFHDDTFSNFDTSFYSTGINTVALILYFYSGSVTKAFICLCNIFSSKEFEGLMDLKVIGSNKAKHAESEIEKKFDSLFKKKLDRLYTHFKVNLLTTSEFLPDMILSLFTNYFDFDLASRILDIFVFQGTDFLIKCSLAFLKKISHKLFGNKDEIIRILGKDCRIFLNQSPESSCYYKYMNVGYSHEFLDLIKNL